METYLRATNIVACVIEPKASLQHEEKEERKKSLSIVNVYLFKSVLLEEGDCL